MSLKISVQQTEKLSRDQTRAFLGAGKEFQFEGEKRILLEARRTLHAQWHKAAHGATDEGE